MPRSELPTKSTSLCEMPPVLWSLIPTATPVSSVPMPSVTTIDSTCTTTTKKALIAPTSSPAPSATRIDGTIDHPWITFSQPTSTSESPITLGDGDVELAHRQRHDQPEREDHEHGLRARDRLDVAEREERVRPQDREDDDHREPDDEDAVAPRRLDQVEAARRGASAAPLRPLRAAPTRALEPVPEGFASGSFRGSIH